MKYTMPRRNFLKSALATTALPASMSHIANVSAAEGDGGPKRAMFVFIPDGAIPSLWHPTGTEFNFSLPSMTSPLERLKNDLVFVRGLEMYAGGATHEGGIKKVLTGNGDISLDAYLANRFKQFTPHAQLYLGVGANFQNGSGGFSFLGAGQPQTAEDNPLSAFDRVFGGGSSIPDIENRRKRSVIDAALADLTRLQTQLGSVEKAKLDTHLESIREVEKRLTNVDAGPQSCKDPIFNNEGFTVPDGYHGYPPKYQKEDHFETVGKLQMDLATLALQCDMTRVVSLQWSHPVSPTQIAASGASMRNHDASHYGNEGSQTAQEFVKLKQWFNRQFAYLIDSLKAVPEGNGTMLDNTLIFMFSELGDGNRHDHRDMPFILAGGAGGALDTGRFLNYEGEAHSKLLVSIANAMGENINSFGYTGHGTGGLPGLLK